MIFSAISASSFCLSIAGKTLSSLFWVANFPNCQIARQISKIRGGGKWGIEKENGKLKQNPTPGQCLVGCLHRMMMLMSGRWWQTTEMRDKLSDTFCPRLYHPRDICPENKGKEEKTEFISISKWTEPLNLLTCNAASSVWPSCAVLTH